MESKKRIEYIDLMKGICIILVVMNHSGVMRYVDFGSNFFWMMLSGRMPLYFFLSGMFFKNYGSFSDFFWRKFRMLVVPILVFAPLGAIIIMSVPWQPWSYDGLTRFSMWVGHVTRFTNGPLWFLRALFVASLLMYGLYNVAERGVVGVLSVIVISVVISGISVCLSINCLPSMDVVNKKIFLRCGLFHAMALFPYFLAGFFAVRLGVLKLNRSNLKVTVSVAIVFLISFVAGSVLIDAAHIGWARLVFFTPTYSIAVSPWVAIIFVWSASFLVQRVPFVSYVGRYSIIVLVTHYPLVMSLSAFGLNPWLILLIVLSILPFVIRLCVRYIPWACAQPYNKSLKNGIQKAY